MAGGVCLCPESARLRTETETLAKIAVWKQSVSEVKTGGELIGQQMWKSVVLGDQGE